MRIIYLNCWQGNIWDKFQDFIRKQVDLTDVFCFQEISPELFSKISEILPDYNGQYNMGGKYYPHGVWYGQAVFVRNSIETSVSRKTPIFNESKDKIGFMQHLSIKQGNRTIFVGNVHGNPHPGNKQDTPVRINQSQKILDPFKNKSGPKIIGGDFNLLPNTKSIKLFEKAGFRNLIKDFNIEKTRNEITWKFHSKGKKNFVRQYYADYVFISNDIRIKNFEVPDIEISDHLPLILDFDI
ncbi:MAG: endonuclease/exonuclease/phosphatase family protein [Candidatus Woesebacteria bacterium]|nr:endonuclease/exonuclease/phosphatase family protein [Candidatus Woesebacteria bacterium]